MVQSELKLSVKLRTNERALTCMWEKNSRTGDHWHNIRMDRELGGTLEPSFVSIFSFGLEKVGGT